jgi:hypothetical protein
VALIDGNELRAEAQANNRPANLFGFFCHWIPLDSSRRRSPRAISETS